MSAYTDYTARQVHDARAQQLRSDAAADRAARQAARDHSSRDGTGSLRGRPNWIFRAGRPRAA